MLSLMMMVTWLPGSPAMTGVYDGPMVTASLSRAQVPGSVRPGARRTAECDRDTRRVAELFRISQRIGLWRYFLIFILFVVIKVYPKFSRKVLWWPVFPAGCVLAPNVQRNYPGRLGHQPQGAHQPGQPQPWIRGSIFSIFKSLFGTFGTHFLRSVKRSTLNTFGLA